MEPSETICRTCKHWEPAVVPKQYHWSYFKEDQVLGQCRAGTPDYDREGYGPLMAAVCESESIGGELITDENFGCILHEVKT